ncbi:MAG: DoxX family protein [Minisyncoccia bacterium]|jgi:putative oxidoreductase
MIQPFLVFGDLGIAILRVILALILIAHGWPKIKDIKGTAAWMGQTFKPGFFWATVVALTEFVGGIFLLFGFLAQLVALLVAVEFLVIVFTVKRGKGFVGGNEFELLILAAALALLTLGSGHYGLDYYWGVLLY